ncbi:MAG: DUF1192 domain-containing protein [Pseudolabrys sp.]|jgi:uncharacterized small protein (DUF1192 family)
MAIFDDDDRPKKKISHEIGQDLSLISVDEITARIALLQDEIKRLEADKAQKHAKRAAADQFFKRQDG